MINTKYKVAKYIRLTDEDREILENLQGRKVIIIVNKLDLTQKLNVDELIPYEFNIVQTSINSCV